MIAANRLGRLLSNVYVGTVGTEVIVLLAKLVIYRLAAVTFDDSTLGVYLVATQVVAVAQSAIVIGADVALTKALASQGYVDRARLTSSALCTSVGAAALVALSFVLLRSELGRIIFGHTGRSAVLLGVAAMICGAGLQPVVAAYFRGLERFGAANALQLLVHVLVPLPAILLLGPRLSSVLIAIGAGWVLVSAIFLILARPGRLTFHVDRALVRFGLTRAAADFLQVAFLATPVMVAPHVTTIAQAGDVALGIAVVTMVGSTFVPFGFVLLPRVARHALTAGQEMEALVRRVVTAAAAIGGVGTLAAWISAPWIMGVYLGRADDTSVSLFRIIALASAPFTVYIASRRVVDGATKKAHNATNLAITMATLSAICGLALLRGSVYIVAGGFVVASWLQGAMSIRTLLRVRGQLRLEPPARPSTTVTAFKRGQ